jgi:hypothetical protein
MMALSVFASTIPEEAAEEARLPSNAYLTQGIFQSGDGISYVEEDS